MNVPVPVPVRDGWRLVVLAALTACLPVVSAPAAAEAQPARQKIVAPQEDALVRGATLRARVRDAGPGFRAIVGARDVTDRFRARRGGARVAQLRPGRDLRRGVNRLVVSSGRGAERRHAARTFVVGVRSGARCGCVASLRLAPPCACVWAALDAPASRRCA